MVERRYKHIQIFRLKPFKNYIGNVGLRSDIILVNPAEGNFQLNILLILIWIFKNKIKLACIFSWAQAKFWVFFIIFGCKEPLNKLIANHYLAF